MTTAVAVLIACAVIYGLHPFTCHVAGHEHIPTPSGRCLVCGLDAQEKS